MPAKENVAAIAQIASSTAARPVPKVSGLKAARPSPANLTHAGLPAVAKAEGSRSLSSSLAEAVAGHEPLQTLNHHRDSDPRKTLQPARGETVATAESSPPDLTDGENLLRQLGCLALDNESALGPSGDVLPSNKHKEGRSVPTAVPAKEPLARPKPAPRRILPKTLPLPIGPAQIRRKTVSGSLLFANLAFGSFLYLIKQKQLKRPIAKALPHHL